MVVGIEFILVNRNDNNLYMLKTIKLNLIVNMRNYYVNVDYVH